MSNFSRMRCCSLGVLNWLCSLKEQDLTLSEKYLFIYLCMSVFEMRSNLWSNPVRYTWANLEQVKRKWQRSITATIIFTSISLLYLKVRIWIHLISFLCCRYYLSSLQLWSSLGLCCQSGGEWAGCDALSWPRFGSLHLPPRMPLAHLPPAWGRGLVWRGIWWWSGVPGDR